uniref:(northern house mosquito) hypothetical protein n=1 Tax=Culex pipiens TaxID=7175 RepID=A0A8D8E6R1_CULPI
MPWMKTRKPFTSCCTRPKANATMARSPVGAKTQLASSWNRVSFRSSPQQSPPRCATAPSGRTRRCWRLTEEVLRRPRLIHLQRQHLHLRRPSITDRVPAVAVTWKPVPSLLRPRRLMVPP